MRVDGPEFQRGWHARLDVDGTAVIVEARHYHHERLPTAHEFARQAMRGRGHSMVESPIYEWSAHIRSGTLGRCTIRPTASGLFEIAGVRRLHPTLEGAVRAWAGPIVARAVEARATRELSSDETSGPKP
jgi:hypothetical protein